MAWIESHQDIAQHPKLYHLAALTGLSHNHCIAILHRLWWWCLSYAEDGDLSKFIPEQIISGIGETEKGIFSALVETKWIDKDMFVHDWMEYAGRYLKSKYHTANPVKYNDIISKHLGRPKSTPKGQAKNKNAKPKVIHQPTNQDNLNQPTLTNLPEGLTPSVWESFSESRKILKAPLSDHAMSLIFKKLSEFKEMGMAPDDIINQSIEKGWKGIFPLSGFDTKNNKHSQTLNKFTGLNEKNYHEGVNPDGSF